MKSMLKTMVILIGVLIPMAFSYAQDITPIDPPVPPIPIERGVVYKIEPDYRRCAFPFCGGWWLTPVNQIQITLPTVDDLDAGIVPVPAPIYVASIDYSNLGLTEAEINRFEYLIITGQALIRGALVGYPWTGQYPPKQELRSLRASATWYAANTNQPFGPYLDVKSTGIMCITTPCPYFQANQVNTYWSFQFHEINFDRAELTERQLALAKRSIEDRSLMMTGVRFVSEGRTGDGIGIAATQVYFDFPSEF